MLNYTLESHPFVPPYREFLEPGAQQNIKMILSQQQVATLETIQEPIAVKLAATRMRTNADSNDGVWLAMIALAGVIILFCIVGIIIILFTWSR